MWLFQRNQRLDFNNNHEKSLQTHDLIISLDALHWWVLKFLRSSKYFQNNVHTVTMLLVIQSYNQWNKSDELSLLVNY